MASLYPIGSVVELGGRRSVVAGHRISPDGELMGAGYLVVPYPLGFVGAQSLAVVPASAVGSLAHEGLATEEDAAYRAEFAELVAEHSEISATEYAASTRLLTDFARSRSQRDRSFDSPGTGDGLVFHTGKSGEEEAEGSGRDKSPSPVPAAPTQNAGITPVGSVVRLVEADAQVMVLGFEPELGDGERADYLGVPYPMGLVSDDVAFAFDASAVAEVVHQGLWDAEAEAGIAAVRRFHAATADAECRVRELIDTLTPERFLELREKYVARPVGLGDDKGEADGTKGAPTESQGGRNQGDRYLDSPEGAKTPVPLTPVPLTLSTDTDESAHGSDFDDINLFAEFDLPDEPEPDLFDLPDEPEPDFPEEDLA